MTDSSMDKMRLLEYWKYEELNDGVIKCVARVYKIFSWRNMNWMKREKAVQAIVVGTHPGLGWNSFNVPLLSTAQPR